MAATGKLKLNLVTVDGAKLREDVDVELRHLRLGAPRHVRIKAGKSTVIDELEAQPDGVYRVLIDPPSFRPVGQFVTVKSSGLTTLDLTFPVDPAKVKALQVPAYEALSADARRILDGSNSVLLFDGLAGAGLYSAFDDTRRAGLLNIIAKCAATTFASGQSVLSYVGRLVELRGDRFFAHVKHELREETKNAVHTGLFEPASDLLHHPPDGFARAGSFKTRDDYGNLQLSFFVKPDAWLADIDIDDAGGIGHVFQVLRNTLTGRPTHPYDIHELLVHHQKLDPSYSLEV